MFTGVMTGKMNPLAGRGGRGFAFAAAGILFLLFILLLLRLLIFLFFLSSNKRSKGGSTLAGVLGGSSCKIFD